MAGAGAEYLASIFGTEKDKYVIYKDYFAKFLIFSTSIVKL
jgi:hypothetical protein